MSEITLYNLAEQKWMRLDRKEVNQAINGSFDSKLVFDYIAGKYKRLCCEDLRRAASGSSLTALILVYNERRNVLVDSEKFREAIGR